MSDTFVFNKDHTYTDTTDFPPVVTKSGTWLVDPAAKTITVTITESSNPDIVPVGYTMTAQYSFCNQHTTLILVVSEGIGAGTGVCTKQ